MGLDVSRGSLTSTQCLFIGPRGQAFSKGKMMTIDAYVDNHCNPLKQPPLVSECRGLMGLVITNALIINVFAR